MCAITLRIVSNDWVFEGGDRYASEMLRYRFDRKKLKEKEAVTV